MFLYGASRKADPPIVKVKDCVVVAHERVAEDPEVVTLELEYSQEANALLTVGVVLARDLVGVRLTQCYLQRREIVFVFVDIWAVTGV